MNIRITEIHSVLELVKPVLEDSEPEQQPDQNHHQNQARAAHANSPRAAHLCFALLERPKWGFGFEILEFLGMGICGFLINVGGFLCDLIGE